MIKDNELKDTRREISYLVCATGIVFSFFMFILSSA